MPIDTSPIDASVQASAKDVGNFPTTGSLNGLATTITQMSRKAGDVNRRLLTGRRDDLDKHEWQAKSRPFGKSSIRSWLLFTPTWPRAQRNSCVRVTQADEEASCCSSDRAERGRPPRFCERYMLGPVIGSGTFATVSVARRVDTRELFACKTMSARDAAQNDSQESEFLCRMQHQHIVTLHDYFEEDGKVYVIQELLKGGDVQTALADRGSYAEEDARDIVRQLLLALEHLHSHGVVHRDLKLENLMLCSAHDVTKIKLVDFGLAAQLKHSDDVLTDRCGSPLFVAPEIICQEVAYGTKVDMWSAGVISFMLLSGYPPFHNLSLHDLFRDIWSGNYNFHDPVWELISDDAAEFVKSLLVFDPSQRMSATEALRHPWLAANS